MQAKRGALARQTFLCILTAMSTEAAPGFSLFDPRLVAASAPYTFFLPFQAHLDAITPGDIVKLNFEYTHPTEKWAAERMWVIVKTVAGDHLTGTLDNDPYETTTSLKAGDVVVFRRHHILDVDWAEPAEAPATPPRRTYWQRCFVDQCVVDGDEPIEYLYREEPESDASDEYPDSGWRIRGRLGSQTLEDAEAREVAYVAIGLVLNQDDSWLRWIDAPVGTALLRDSKGEYVEER